MLLKQSFSWYCISSHAFEIYFHIPVISIKSKIKVIFFSIDSDTGHIEISLMDLPIFLINYKTLEFHYVLGALTLVRGSKNVLLSRTPWNIQGIKQQFNLILIKKIKKLLAYQLFGKQSFIMNCWSEDESGSFNGGTINYCSKLFITGVNVSLSFLNIKLMSISVE